MHRMQHRAEQAAPEQGSMHRVIQAICIFVALLVAGAAHATCPAPTLMLPAERTTAQTQPTIRWSAVVGADAYALKLQSRAPEGRLIASLDVAVQGVEFTPPGALAEERAKVTLSVTARCAGVMGAPAQAWFLIDAGAACAAPADLRLRLENGREVAQWSAVAGANLYELRLHAAMDGLVLRLLESREPRLAFDDPPPAGAVLSVRPRCGRVLGDVAFVLAPAR